MQGTARAESRSWPGGCLTPPLLQNANIASFLRSLVLKWSPKCWNAFNDVGSGLSILEIKRLNGILSFDLLNRFGNDFVGQGWDGMLQVDISKTKNESNN